MHHSSVGLPYLLIIHHSSYLEPTFCTVLTTTTTTRTTTHSLLWQQLMDETTKNMDKSTDMTTVPDQKYTGMEPRGLLATVIIGSPLSVSEVFVIARSSLRMCDEAA
jgi:hypothetical protein